MSSPSRPPAVLVAGFGAGGTVMAPLARLVEGLGYAPHPAPLGRGLGCGERSTGRLLAFMEEVTEKHGEPAVLLAHSRGGQFARVAGVRRPDLVRGFIALGSPFGHLALGLHVRAAAAALGVAGSLGIPGVVTLGCAFGRCCAEFRRDLAAPWPGQVPFLSVYSRTDRTVKWRTCVDPAAENVEVGGGHVGLLRNARSQRAVAATLRAWFGVRPALLELMARP